MSAADGTGEPALRCEAIGKQVAGAEILADVHIAVARGSAVALMGANGAGKSTLLDIVCGLTRPTHGRVQVLGADPGDAVRAGRVGAMLQSGGLLPELTVGETLTHVGEFFGLRDARTLAERHGLGPIATRRVGACSGGERQWVKWALAQVSDPELLVLDEPTAGMDWRSRQGFWQQVRSRRASGSTVFYATHYADEVVGIADRIVLLAHGRVVGVTTPHAAVTAGGGPDEPGALFVGLAALEDASGGPRAGGGRR